MLPTAPHRRRSAPSRFTLEPRMLLTLMPTPQLLADLNAGGLGFYVRPPIVSIG